MNKEDVVKEYNQKCLLLGDLEARHKIAKRDLLKQITKLDELFRTLTKQEAEKAKTEEKPTEQQ